MFIHLVSKLFFYFSRYIAQIKSFPRLKTLLNQPYLFLRLKITLIFLDQYNLCLNNHSLQGLCIYNTASVLCIWCFPASTDYPVGHCSLADRSWDGAGGSLIRWGCLLVTGSEVDKVSSTELQPGVENELSGFRSPEGDKICITFHTCKQYIQYVSSMALFLNIIDQILKLW